MLLYIILYMFLSGSSDGQTKIVREGDNGVAYSWNRREQKWDKVISVFIFPVLPIFITVLLISFSLFHYLYCYILSFFPFLNAAHCYCFLGSDVYIWLFIQLLDWWSCWWTRWRHEPAYSWWNSIWLWL